MIFLLRNAYRSGANAAVGCSGFPTPPFCRLPRSPHGLPVLFSRLTVFVLFGILNMLQIEHVQRKGVVIMANDTYSEKVSVNINSSTLSSIDILVDNGYYSNRSDFINQALREGLQKHQTTLDRIIDKHMDAEAENPNRWFVGVCSLEQSELEAAQARALTLTYTGYGVLAIDKGIDEALLFSVVERIRVKGKVICTQSVKEHYGLK